MPSSSQSDLILAIDQGTSSTKVIVADATGNIVGSSSVALGQTHPRPGWVEQDATELFSTLVSAVREATAGVAPGIAAVGISSQRESAVIWDPATGLPLGPVLGWQDRRTNVAAHALRSAGHDGLVRRSTGLPIDPMFSALKFAWLLDEIDPSRDRAVAGRIAVGTVDSWLMFCLTGERRIEVGNASRTQLLNLATAQWDEELLELFNIPKACLPEVMSSIDQSQPIVGLPELRPQLHVTAVLGDSHAALYGHGVREPGTVKVTYGTGSSVMGLLPVGTEAADGLVRTIAWSTGTPTEAFEGNILATGATVVWLADLLGTDPGHLAALAEGADRNKDVYLVPAFAGLGAPWWDEQARAAILGFDLGSSAADLARAAFESIPLQVEDVLTAADAACGMRVETILADGGPSSNPWLMQLQADVSQRQVASSNRAELSAVGAARLAAVSAGAWSDADNLAVQSTGSTFLPRRTAEFAESRRQSWHGALAQARYSAGRTPLSTHLTTT